MAKEILDLYTRSLRTAIAPPTREALGILSVLSAEEKARIVRYELQRAADALLEEKPVLFYTVDQTQAGGAHAVQAFFDPKQNRAVIEVSYSQTDVQSSFFPTVLHALEIITATTQLANGCGNVSQQAPNDAEKIPYPTVDFANRDSFRKKSEQAVQPEPIFVPLTIDTRYTNAIIFHPQARHLKPEAIARAYYTLLKDDRSLAEDPIRHTMLVWPRYPEDRPTDKNSMTVIVLPSEFSRRRFKLADVRRVTDWAPTNQNVIYEMGKGRQNGYQLPSREFF